MRVLHVHKICALLPPDESMKEKTRGKEAMKDRTSEYKYVLVHALSPKPSKEVNAFCKLIFIIVTTFVN